MRSFRGVIQFKIVLIGALIVSTITLANPQGGLVTAGSATIQQTTNTTTIDQSSKNVIINWQSFNIGQQQTTHFQQPTGGIALNRISPTQGVSQIYGHLSATGQIILINPAGVYFGPSAYVNVGGLIATTANITDQNFLNGHYQFTPVPGYPGGSIINAGHIIAANHGLIALVGEGVENTGMIRANFGNIVLASGSAFTVSFAGNNLISFVVDAPASHAGVDKDNHMLKSAVSNSGRIIANGGRVLVTAAAVQGVLDNAINMQGIIEAHSVGLKNGEVILIGNNGNVKVSGTIVASGIKRGESGGKIKILGTQVNLIDSANIDVSGTNGGGEVLIGGNLHGAGPEMNALTTNIGSDVFINANALQQGNGGKIIVWSNGMTTYAGHSSATGGIGGGDGGFVEVSGHQLLNFHGLVDLNAQQGETGTLLLDPENLTIQTNGSTTATYTSGSYTANVANSILTVNDLQAVLENANVLVQTGTSGSQAGDITVANNVTWSNQHTLVLSAFRNINMNATISNASGGSLNLMADNSGTGTGTIIFSGVTPQIVMSGGGMVKFYYNPIIFPTPTNFSAHVTVASGTSFTPYMLVNNLNNLQNINNNVSGNYALGQNINASATSGWNAGQGFDPISVFTGKFDGNYHTISNLYINRPIFHVGLFGLTDGATISNISLVNADVAGDARVGILVGFANNATTITNAHTSGVASGLVVGGLVGILGDDDGSFKSHIYNSSSSASVFGGGYAGGLAGAINAPIDNSTSSGNVIGGNLTGGFVGWNFGATINQSSSSGSVTGNDVVGGFTGENDGNIIQSFSSGNTSGGKFVGGLVGVNIGTITDSYSRGNVIGVDQTGGFVGENDGTINTSFSAGNVAASGMDVGGLVGYTAGISSVTDSYWDIDTSGLSTSVGGVGLTDQQMIQKQNFAGFNFNTVWAIYNGSSFPFLQWQNPITPPIPPYPVPPTPVIFEAGLIPGILMHQSINYIFWRKRLSISIEEVNANLADRDIIKGPDLNGIPSIQFIGPTKSKFVKILWLEDINSQSDET